MGPSRRGVTGAGFTRRLLQARMHGRMHLQGPLPPSRPKARPGCCAAKGVEVHTLYVGGKTAKVRLRQTHHRLVAHPMQRARSLPLHLRVSFKVEDVKRVSNEQRRRQTREKQWTERAEAVYTPGRCPQPWPKKDARSWPQRRKVGRPPGDAGLGGGDGAEVSFGWVALRRQRPVTAGWGETRQRQATST